MFEVIKSTKEIIAQIFAKNIWFVIVSHVKSKKEIMIGILKFMKIKAQWIKVVKAAKIQISFLSETNFLRIENLGNMSEIGLINITKERAYQDIIQISFQYCGVKNKSGVRQERIMKIFLINPIIFSSVSNNMIKKLEN